jgi:leader peptidase (prepilin peptidase)/N-methyltransferase
MVEDAVAQVLPPVVFIFGLCVGSFLNVVIARLPLEKSIVKPSSHCPRCGHILKWYENIPLFSWMVLRGRCSRCKERISFRYPAIELLTGILFGVSAALFEPGWVLVRALLLIGFLIPLSFIDLEHWILPFSLTLPGLLLGLCTSFPLGWEGVQDSLLGAGVGFCAFWLLEWVGAKIFKKEALGAGDKYLLALLGSFLSWRALLGIIFLSSLQASIVGILLIKLRGRAGPAPKPVDKKADHEEEDDWVPGPTNIPLGPWLALAGLEILFFAPVFAEHLPWPTSALFGGWL